VETFGNPLAEGMACGAPVAVSNTAAMPEIVGDTARMFDPLDAEDMADAIIDILRNPTLAEDLRKKGRKRAQMFSWAETAMRTADVLIAAAATETSRATGRSVSDAR
jgi:glycosyltransferase involved in cell wall biosynthesis